MKVVCGNFRQLISTTHGRQALTVGLQSYRLRGGFNLQHRAGFFVSEQIQQSVWSLPHVTDSLMQIGEEAFAALLAFVVEHDSLQMTCTRDPADRHRAD